MDVAASLLPIAIVSVLVLVALKASRKSKSGAAAPPPGPSWIWVLAELFMLRRRNPPMGIKTLILGLRTRYGPIASLGSGKRTTVFVFDSRLAHEALVQNSAALAGRPPAISVMTGNRQNIGSSSGPLWRLLRRNLAARTLHPSVVRLFAPARRLILADLLDRLRSESSGGEAAVAVFDALQQATFTLHAFMCFGEKIEDGEARRMRSVQHELLLWFRRFNVTATLPEFLVRTIFRRRWLMLLSLRRIRKEIFMPLIEKKKKEEEGYCVESYIDSLLELRLTEAEISGGGEGRELTDDELVALCSEFLIAGTDTTATALQWVLANLVRHPEIQIRLAEEIAGAGDAAVVGEEDLVSMPYLRAVVMEALRMYPPGHFLLPHAVSEDLVLGGGRWLISKGTMMNFAVSEIGRDDGAWESPEEFRPERFLAGGDGEGVDVAGGGGGREMMKMMPFGAGRRICPGMAVAMLHLEFFVANLVREFVWEEEVEGEAVNLEISELEHTVDMRRPLRVRIRPRLGVY